MLFATCCDAQVWRFSLLDDMTVEELARKLNTPILPVRGVEELVRFVYLLLMSIKFPWSVLSTLCHLTKTKGKTKKVKVRNQS